MQDNPIPSAQANLVNTLKKTFTWGAATVLAALGTYFSRQVQIPVRFQDHDVLPATDDGLFLLGVVGVITGAGVTGHLARRAAEEWSALAHHDRGTQTAHYTDLLRRVNDLDRMAQSLTPSTRRPEMV